MRPGAMYDTVKNLVIRLSLEAETQLLKSV